MVVKQGKVGGTSLCSRIETVRVKVWDQWRHRRSVRWIRKNYLRSPALDSFCSTWSYCQMLWYAPFFFSSCQMGQINIKYIDSNSLSQLKGVFCQTTSNSNLFTYMKLTCMVTSCPHKLLGRCKIPGFTQKSSWLCQSVFPPFQQKPVNRHA